MSNRYQAWEAAYKQLTDDFKASDPLSIQQIEAARAIYHHVNEFHESYNSIADKFSYLDQIQDPSIPISSDNYLARNGLSDEQISNLREEFTAQIDEYNEVNGTVNTDHQINPVTVDGIRYNAHPSQPATEFDLNTLEGSLRAMLVDPTVETMLSPFFSEVGDLFLAKVVAKAGVGLIKKLSEGLGLDALDKETLQRIEGVINSADPTDKLLQIEEILEEQGNRTNSEIPQVGGSADDAPVGTFTNDGTIDGEGGGPPPLADVDWDRLEQTASNGDQASDVIYDADLEQTPPTTPDDLLAGGSPDDAFANPEPPESSFIDAVGDTLEDIGDALESAWEDRGAQAVGAAASASFMTYANLNGWTEEDWLDESHEQSIASFVVNEVAQDIVTFDFSAGDFNLFEWNAVNANGDAVAGTGANMIASLAAGELAKELGLGGTDLASTVGTSMAISGMQYTISTISTGEITAQIQPHVPPRLCFSVREPLKVNNNWGQVVETPRLGEVRTVAVQQGQATAPLGAAA